MPTSALGETRFASATLIAHDASNRAASASTASLDSRVCTATPATGRAGGAHTKYTPKAVPRAVEIDDFGSTGDLPPGVCSNVRGPVGTGMTRMTRKRPD